MLNLNIPNLHDNSFNVFRVGAGVDRSNPDDNFMKL